MYKLTVYLNKSQEHIKIFYKIQKVFIIREKSLHLKMI